MRIMSLWKKSHEDNTEQNVQSHSHDTYLGFAYNGGWNAGLNILISSEQNVQLFHSHDEKQGDSNKS